MSQEEITEQLQRENGKLREENAQLRAKLGNRLILRVDSEGTSEVALGEKGAERLLGRGHLLAKLEGSPLCYAQVPLVEEQFVEKLISVII